MRRCSSRVWVAAALCGSWLVLQGCALAVVWVGAVGFDNARRSNIEFHPFENSWLASSEQRQEPLASIAVLPFPGQTPMAERWTTLLEGTTELQVIGPAEVTRLAGEEAVADFTQSRDESDAARSAVELSDRLRVDALLFGRVDVTGQEESFGGIQTKQDRRLYLYLTKKDGTLLWKDELPFTVVQGDKKLDQVDEEWTQRRMVWQVLDHARKIGLAGVGLPLKAQTESAS